MAFCPSCRSEFRREFTHCPTCDVDLVAADELPQEISVDEAFAAMSDEELASVARGTVEWCQEVQHKLLARQIPAVIRKVDDDVAEAGHYLILQVIVRAQDRDAAMALFNDELRETLERDGLTGTFDDEEGDDDEDDAEGELACPACGSTDPLVDGECPECGLYLGEE